MLLGGMALLLHLTWLQVRCRTPGDFSCPGMGLAVHRGWPWAARTTWLDTGEGRRGWERVPRAPRSDGRTSSVSAEKCLANKLAKRP